MKKILLLLMVIFISYSCCEKEPPSTKYINSLPEGIVINTYAKGRHYYNYYVKIRVPGDILEFEIPEKYYIELDNGDTIRHTTQTGAYVKELDVEVKEQTSEVKKITGNKPIKID